MKKTIIYILGSPRCGSTILGSYLNQYINALHVGELRFIWDRGFKENWMCGNGKQFLDHPFWKIICEEVFPGNNLNIAIDKIFRSSERGHILDGTRPLIRKRDLLFRDKQVVVNRIKTNYQEYIQYLHKLYRAIFKLSAAEIIIDTSKEPIYGLIVNNIKDYNIIYVHLIRDSRAVVNSRVNNKKENKISKNYKTKMGEGRTIFNTTIDWIKRNYYISKHFADHKNYVQIKFEDFVCKPHIYIEILNKYLYHKLDVIDYDKQENIVFSGNPSRFSSGKIELKYTENWQKQLKKIDKATVKLMTYPIMKKYKYY